MKSRRWTTHSDCNPGSRRVTAASGGDVSGGEAEEAVEASGSTEQQPVTSPPLGSSKHLLSATSMARRKSVLLLHSSVNCGGEGSGSGQRDEGSAGGKLEGMQQPQQQPPSLLEQERDQQQQPVLDEKPPQQLAPVLEQAASLSHDDDGGGGGEGSIQMGEEAELQAGAGVRVEAQPAAAEQGAGVRAEAQPAAAADQAPLPSSPSGAGEPQGLGECRHAIADPLPPPALAACSPPSPPPLGAHIADPLLPPPANDDVVVAAPSTPIPTASAEPPLEMKAAELQTAGGGENAEEEWAATLEQRRLRGLQQEAAGGQPAGRSPSELSHHTTEAKDDVPAVACSRGCVGWGQCLESGRGVTPTPSACYVPPNVCPRRCPSLAHTCVTQHLSASV